MKKGLIPSTCVGSRRREPAQDKRKAHEKIHSSGTKYLRVTVTSVTAQLPAGNAIVHNPEIRCFGGVFQCLLLWPTAALQNRDFHRF